MAAFLPGAGRCFTHGEEDRVGARTAAKGEGDQLASKWPWKDIVTIVGSLVGVLGFAFFAVSNSAYGHFYSSLGTTPTDVGLTYFGVLAASTGWAIALALGLTIVVLTLVALLPRVELGDMVSEHLRTADLTFVAQVQHGWRMLRSAIRDREWRLPRDEQDARWNAREAAFDAALEQARSQRDTFFQTEIEPGTKIGQLWADGIVSKAVVTVVLFLFLSFLVIDPINHTLQFADQVRAGHSGGVTAGLWGLPLVRLRADEVRVASAGDVGQFPAVDRLRGRNLIYLGEANSKAVLYDPGHRVTFYMPAATLVLEVRQPGT
jgi:hypothetical protein